MFFNSIDFLIFLPVVFYIYWFLLDRGDIRFQNIFLLSASYVFYSWWDWRFLSLIILSSFTDYFIGNKIFRTEHPMQRKMLLWTSITINLGFLAYFKYSNFFISSFADFAATIGFQINYETLKIVLPVGISFYTFQTLCYTIDIYRYQLKPTQNILSFFNYVSFFPQLVAGPIERAQNLLPQFQNNRHFNIHQASNGLRYFLWGIVLKVVIADPSGIYVDQIFGNHHEMSPIELLIGAIYFAFQIYGDFAGYSYMAVGIAKLFGFELMKNFDYPYFALNVTEFWRRWHISLSTWIRDYLYNPMAIGLRGWGMTGIISSLILSFTIIGLWHGSNWNYIVFGLLHGLALAFEAYTKKQRKRIRKRVNTIFYSVTSWSLTMLFWVFTLIFFRADGLSHALDYLSSLFSMDLLEVPHRFLRGFVWIAILFIIEYFFKNRELPLYLPNKPRIINWGMYIVAGIVVVLFFKPGGEKFIYFQF